MKTETVYLENKEQSLFLEITASDTELQIRRGLINEPCLVFVVDIAGAEWIWQTYKNLKIKFIKAGYVFLDTATVIIEGSKAELIGATDIKKNHSYSKLTSIGNFELYNAEENFFAWHFIDGISFNGNLDIAMCADMFNAAGLIIEGDVNVKGVFGQYQDNYPDATLILGNVSCQSFIHENSHVVIEGNLTVEQTIFGNYNEGSLKITGDVQGEAMISYDHQMWAEGKYRLFHGDLFNEGIPDWLNPQLIDEEQSLDTDELLKSIYAGKSILRKGVSFINEEKTAEADIETIEEEPFFDPALMDAINELAMQDDGMGITLTLVKWPKRDHAWLQLMQSRMWAPSATNTEKELLQEALAEYQESIS